MLKGLLLAALIAAPVALAAPFPGASECAEANAVLDQVDEDVWYEFCGQVMGLGAEPSLFYTQVALGCEGPSCAWRPTMEIALDVVAPGSWELQATSLMRHYPSNNVIAGSQRSLECAIEGPAATCSAAAVNRDIGSNQLNSARWEGEWRLYYFDALGAPHLQATGLADGWLAQYY